MIASVGSNDRQDYRRVWSLKFALASPEIKKHVWIFSAQKPVIWSHMLKYIVKQLCFEISLRKPNTATDILQLFFKPQFSLCNVQINTDLAHVILDPWILEYILVRLGFCSSSSHYEMIKPTKAWQKYIFQIVYLAQT